MAKPFRLSDEVHEGLKQYSEATGVPMSRVVNEAMGDWLKTVGTARMEFFKQATVPETSNLVEMASA